MSKRKYTKQIIEEEIYETCCVMGIKEIIEEFGSDVSVEAIEKFYDYGGGSYSALRIFKRREETDEEFNERVNVTEQRYKLHEESERLKYEELKKKFEK